MGKPTMIDRLSHQLQAKGMPAGKARAVATKRMQEAGNVKPGTTTQTAKGDRRQAMGAKGRAVDRAAKASGHDRDDFKYSARTNRATLRK